MNHYVLSQGHMTCPLQCAEEPLRCTTQSDVTEINCDSQTIKRANCNQTNPKVDPLIPTLLQDEDLTRNPHTSYTKFKRLMKKFWLGVSLIHTPNSNTKFIHQIQTSFWMTLFHWGFWLGCGRVSRFESCCFFSGEITKEVSREIQEFKQWKKGPWLFRVYRGLYYPIIWGL